MYVYIYICTYVYTCVCVVDQVCVYIYIYIQTYIFYIVHAYVYVCECELLNFYYDLTCLLWDRLTWLPCQRVETLSRLILHHGCPVKSLALSVCWQVFHGCVAFAQLCSTENARLQDDIEHHNSIPSMSSGQCCDSTCLDRNVSHMGMGQHRVAPKTGEGSYMHLIVIERYMPCLKHVRCKPYV